MVFEAASPSGKGSGKNRRASRKAKREIRASGIEGFSIEADDPPYPPTAEQQDIVEEGQQDPLTNYLEADDEADSGAVVVTDDKHASDLELAATSQITDSESRSPDDEQTTNEEDSSKWFERLRRRKRSKKSEEPAEVHPTEEEAEDEEEAKPTGGWLRSRFGQRKKPKAAKEDSTPHHPAVTKSRTVFICDGLYWMRVRLKKGKVADYKKSDQYDTDIEAAEAALKALRKARGRKILVWASGEQLPRAAPGVLQDVHQTAISVKTAHSLREIFAPGDHPAALFGEVAMVARGPSAKVLFKALKRKTKVIFAANAVGTQEGMWLRVGHESVQASFVKNGQVVSVALLSDGIDKLQTELQEADAAGHDGAVQLHNFVNTVSTQVMDTISAWLGIKGSVQTIWLHGPGADVSGLRDSLMNSGCHVTPPPLPEWEFADSVSERNSVISALMTRSDGVPLVPQAVLAAESQKVWKKPVLVGAVYVGFLILLGVWSFIQGSALKSSIAAVEEDLEEAEWFRAVWEDEKIISDTAESSVALLRGLRLPVGNSEPAPPPVCILDWESVMEYQTRDRTEEQFSFPPGEGGNVLLEFPLIEEIYSEEWVIEIEQAIERATLLAGDGVVGESRLDAEPDTEVWFSRFVPEDEELDEVGAGAEGSIGTDPALEGIEDIVASQELLLVPLECGVSE